jgi:serine protease
MQELVHPPRGARTPQRPSNVRPVPSDTPTRSGFVIVRLRPGIAALESDTLANVAQRLQLSGLAAVLDVFDVLGTRTIRSAKSQEILELERKAASTEFPPLHSLTSYWRLDLRHQPDRIDDIVKRLSALPEVDRAYVELATSEPLVNDADDDYAADQDYLDAAPVGIDARWAWTQPNSEGAGIAFIDLEQGWFPNHEDLVAKAPTLIYGDNRDGVGFYKGNHGAAVLGEVVGVDNTVGVVGIAPAVTSVRLVSHFDAATGTNLHVADAVLAATLALGPGDVLLLEVQRGVGQPTETDDEDFDAIRLAVANGLIVVEAAGNGDVDLDAYTDGGLQVLNRASADFRDSGAIMVGAAEAPLPHDRAYFSCYGSRIDCYGWGEQIVTCGYGDLDDGGGDDNLTYTDTFGGTSGASPMVTGAALILQGRYAATSGTRLSPTQMRTLLSDPATGTPQGPNIAGAIGVMPDLRAVIENTLCLVPDVYIRDNAADNGSIPTPGSLSTSPDIIVRPSTVADPDAEFGEGSGNENSMTLGFEAEAGQDNYIYVRTRNRGSSDAMGVTATVYWSEVATLVTPANWHVIGTTAPVNVPQGDTLVVAGPLAWPAAQIPATGHYCFVGLLHHVQDPAPPIPGPTDWNGFLGMVRNQNNVTWRNFNVVDEIPDPTGDPTALPFLIVGAPDRAREFEMQIFRNVPRDARVRLEVPLGLAAKLKRGRLWPMEIDRKRRCAIIDLPPLPRLDLGTIRLGAGARYPSRFIVHGSPAMRGGGHGIAIRQAFEKEEVGRVSWHFHVRVGAEKHQRKQRVAAVGSRDSVKESASVKRM